MRIGFLVKWARVGAFVFALTVFCYLPRVFAARPLATDDAGTVEKGAFEGEFGVEYVKASDNETNLSVVIKTGILDNLDLGVEIPYLFIDSKEESDTDGLSDVCICMKLNILNEHSVFPDTALTFNYKSDSGNDRKALGTGRPGFDLTAVFSKSFDPLTCHLNIGYSFRKDFDNEDNKDAFTYGFAVEYPLNDTINLVGEITGETELEGEFNDNSCGALIGFNYAFNDMVTFDLGVATAISRAEPDLKVTAGVTIAL